MDEEEYRKYSTGRCEGPVKGKDLLLAIIKTEADCLLIKDRDCVTCSIYLTLDKEQIDGNAICRADPAISSNQRERYELAVDLFIKEYGQDELMAHLIGE